MKNASEASGWPQFVREEGELDPENVRVKKDIAAEYGEEALRKSWITTCNALNKITRSIEDKQTSLIPELSYDEAMDMSEAKKDELRSVGCFVIRGAVPKETADGWFDDLQGYVNDNKDTITGKLAHISLYHGWPEETPYILKLYWSKTQLHARTHPRQMALHHALNSLWHDDEDPEKSFAAPVAYADAARIRPPGVPFNGLGPHIDAGSMCRWDEPVYRKTYEKIWAGEPENFDPYDLTVRKRANPAFHPGQAQSRMLRAFQGWTALTKAGAGEGSLLVYPELKYTIAYVLLRPFFQPPADKKDVLDPEKWTFDLEDAWFPGVWRYTPQELSPEPFPHLNLDKCMVNIPTMYPGDTIWWHCDMCHAVEVEHSGDGIASVVYVAATPTTKTNLEYMHEQWKDFLEGVSPADHRGGCHEKSLKGFPGTSAILNGEAGWKASGYVAA